MESAAMFLEEQPNPRAIHFLRLEWARTVPAGTSYDLTIVRYVPAGTLWKSEEMTIDYKTCEVESPVTVQLSHYRKNRTRYLMKLCLII